MEFCAERGLSVGNIYFNHRSLFKYARGQDGVEVKAKEHDRSDASEVG